MAKHYHRIILNVDIETDERLSETEEFVQELAFEAIRKQYPVENIVVTVVEADCLVGRPKDINVGKPIFSE
jgi:hypothetical protein